ncbi:DUF6333 family protein [Streptomyces sp. NPDC008159]|uniref:DUF6333 family protein n=1 Tax=Streptomyces sp. NPDC008159 TaxID=3364817 RepID=UPI0036EB1567
MSDESFWGVGPEQPVVRYGEFSLTVVDAPFPGAAGRLPEHDAERAREFAGSFGTVDAVLEDLGAVSATDAVDLATRADLDVVRVGCWGGVTEILDPALAHCGDTFPVLEQARALRERFPAAAVVAAATLEHHTPHGAWVIAHPDGTSVFAAGWQGQGDWDLDGDVRAVVAAFGIPEDALDEEGIDLDDDPGSLDWDALARLALEQVAPLDHEQRVMSAFRVRHTEDTTFDMEESWLEG